MGLVYLIEDNEMGLYKIGVTRSTGNKRIKELQTGNASQLYLINEFETEEPFKLEKLLHNHHKNKHYNNEWYWLDQEDIDNFVDDCIRLQKIINALKENPYFK